MHRLENSIHFRIIRTTSQGHPSSVIENPAVASAQSLSNKLRIQNDTSPGHWRNAYAQLLLFDRLRRFISTGWRGLTASGFCQGPGLDPNTLFMYPVVYWIQTSGSFWIRHVPIFQAVRNVNLAG